LARQDPAFQRLKRFPKAREGGFALWFAVAVIPIAMLAGAATDLRRWDAARVMVQDAADGAVLAAARSYALSPTSDHAARLADAQAAADGAMQSASAEVAALVKGLSWRVEINETTREVVLHADGRTPLAFGGLLGAVPADAFLAAANDYLVRQDWDEGFATAIHLSVDLRTGAVQVRCAGHPPAVQLNAGSGRWSAVPAEGPALGLIPDVDYPAVRGLLRRGDAIMLYTDGLVETRNRDIALGIDRLLGQAERELRGGFDSGGIRRLIETLGSRNDDRALLVVHRR